MTPIPRHHDLSAIARQAMLSRGLQPDFPPAALAELATFRGPAPMPAAVRDLRALLWCSIDNDTSRDLDQLSVAEPLANGVVKILVAIADVDALVKKGGALDQHAALNTTSVYTPTVIFPMLPERLSTDLTSLADQQDRLALVIEFAVNPDGSIASSDIFAANVRNRAKLAYNSVAAWLKGAAPAPAALAACPGMDEQIRIQDEVAQRLKNLRFQHGALNFETLEASPVFVDGKLSDLRVEEKSRAKELIEDFMIAANGISAAFLKNKRLPSLRRVVREPERWARIVQVAADVHETLPAQPDAAALEAFLAKRRAADPLRFPDLSLTIVKLMGRGEYVVEAPDEPALGHFGLAVMDYAHTTAPNRRFPDLITHRLIKAALAGQAEPYSLDELNALAKHCTEMEDLAAKVERQVRKSAAALLFESKLGQQFDALVTGASEKGTWVRTIAPPVEGKIQHGAAGLDVGQRVRVRLERVDVERGFIDFTALGKIGG